MNFTIRNINTADFPLLIELFKEFANFEKLPHKMTNSAEQMLEEKEHINGYVAIIDTDTIVAYATFHNAYYSWSGKSLYMDDLYVKEEFRRNGIGKALLNTIINQAYNSKCKRVRWQVSNWNTKAQEFYKSMGAEIDTIELNCDLIL